MLEMTKRYLLIIEGDVCISREGPFESEEARDTKARAWKRDNGDEDGIHWLDVSLDPGGGFKDVEVGDYSGAFFEEED